MSAAALSLLGAKALLLTSALTPAVFAVTPSPTPSVELSGARVGPYIPIDTSPNQDGAGGNAFLVVGILILVCVGLFWAMNRSLRTARRNLGGDVIPGRPAPARHVIPQAQDDPPPPL